MYHFIAVPFEVEVFSFTDLSLEVFINKRLDFPIPKVVPRNAYTNSTTPLFRLTIKERFV